MLCARCLACFFLSSFLYFIPLPPPIYFSLRAFFFSFFFCVSILIFSTYTYILSHFISNLLSSTLNPCFLCIFFLVFLTFLFQFFLFSFLSVDSSLSSFLLISYVRPFSAGFLFFPHNASSFPPTSRMFSHSERVQKQGEGAVGTRNYMYVPALPASTSAVRKTWKLVRYTQPRGERRAGRLRGTLARRTCMFLPRHRQCKIIIPWT